MHSALPVAASENVEAERLTREHSDPMDAADSSVAHHDLVAA